MRFLVDAQLPKLRMPFKAGRSRGVGAVAAGATLYRRIHAFLPIVVASTFLNCSVAAALEAEIRAKADGGGTPSVIGVTNLPDETKLMVSLRRKEASYFAQAHTAVQNGQFRTERFSALGKPLPPGDYQLEVTMPLASVQPATVQAVIGRSGERLTGRLVEKSQFGIVLKSALMINIGGSASASSDAAARRDSDVAMQQWRRENCEWIKKVTHSTAPISECIDRLSRQ